MIARWESLKRVTVTAENLLSAIPQKSRNMIFLSHATPEDNEFARWLALQLANEGYAVWCDLTKLLGGEDFWKDIQEAIRTRSVRFLFVLSRSSNVKDGTLQELACAKAVASSLKSEIRDFIIALKIDDLPYSEVDIEIQRLNHVSFRASWAAGLSKILEKLEEDGVPKDPRFNAEAVCTWWRSQPTLSASQGVLQQSDPQVSNWYEIQKFPETLYCHDVGRRKPGKLDFDVSGLSYPAAKITDLSFLSFAKADVFAEELDPSIYIASSRAVFVSQIVDRSLPGVWIGLLNQMLRQGWEKMMETQGFSVKHVAMRPTRFYLPKDKILNDRIHFVGVDGKRNYRDIVGYATRLGTRRYWHYAVSAKPEMSPFPHFVVRGHVLFSDAGDVLWDNAEKSAKARRNQCKGWWNDEWRDRMLAITTQVSSPQGEIMIPMAPDQSVVLSGRPVSFESPVAYQGVAEMDELLDDYYEDEDDEDQFEEVQAGWKPTIAN
jgi:TIR domain